MPADLPSVGLHGGDAARNLRLRWKMQNQNYKVGQKYSEENPFEVFEKAPNLVLEGHAPNGRPVQVITAEGEGIADIRFLDGSRIRPTEKWELTVTAEFEKGQMPARPERAHAAGTD